MRCPYCTAISAMSPDGTHKWICNRCHRYMVIVDIAWDSAVTLRTVRDPTTPTQTIRHELTTENGYSPMTEV
jgi:hypothetical protein